MLILTRKPNESIQIGDDVRVTVVEFRRGHIRIGVDAPDDVRILRTELIEREREQEESTQ